jgi:hypothetical protein
MDKVNDILGQNGQWCASQMWHPILPNWPK